VVEDNPGEQLSIRELLGYNDIDVTVVSTGAEAIQIVNEQSFDCVVLDLRLPDISGFDVLERFGDTPALSDLPVVSSREKNFLRKRTLAYTRWLAVWSSRCRIARTIAG